MSIIVVDGIDRVGKTTIANKIQAESEFDRIMKFQTYKHDESFVSYDKMDTDNEADKMAQLLTMADMFNCNVLFDRFHLSDFVYGIVGRGYKFSDAYNNMRAIDMMLADMNSVLVYVKPVDLKRSSEEHGSDLTMHDRLMDAAFNDSLMNKIEVNYDVVEDKEYFDCMMNDICRYVKRY